MRLRNGRLYVGEVKTTLNQIILIARKADLEACNYLMNIIQRIIENRFREEIKKTIIPYTPIPSVTKFHKVGQVTTTSIISYEKVVSTADQIRTKRNELIQSIKKMKPSELYQLMRKLNDKESLLRL